MAPVGNGGHEVWLELSQAAEPASYRLGVPGQKSWAALHIQWENRKKNRELSDDSLTGWLLFGGFLFFFLILAEASSFLYVNKEMQELKKSWTRLSTWWSFVIATKLAVRRVGLLDYFSCGSGYLCRDVGGPHKSSSDIWTQRSPLPAVQSGLISNLSGRSVAGTVHELCYKWNK